MKTKVFFVFALIITGIIVASFQACKSAKASEEAFIKPPLPGLEKPYKVFSFDAEKGDSLKYETGSVIAIPPDAFVDSLGNVVKGKIEVKYREMHDAVDIFLSGVPLAYDTAGVKETLKTAGMFEIRAKQAGKTLEFAKGKNAKVKMAGFQVGDEYNFYTLNEQKKNWEYKGTDKAIVNEQKVLKIKEIEKMKPKMVIPFGKEYFAFNYQALLDVFFNDDYNKIYQNQKSKLPGNKAEKYGLKWMDIFAHARVNYKGVETHAAMIVWKKVTEFEFPAWTAKAWTDDIKWLGNNIYSVTIIDDKEHKLVVKIEAVMPIKSLFAYPPEYWKKNYDEAMEKVTKEYEQLKFVADVYRSFDVAVTGYHNWDVVSKNTDKLTVSGDFNFQKKEDGTMHIFYFLANNKSFIKIPQNEWTKLQLVPDSTARMVTILNDKTIAIFSTAKYMKINFDSLRKAPTPSYKFNMETKTVASAEEVKKAMGM